MAVWSAASVGIAGSVARGRGAAVGAPDPGACNRPAQRVGEGAAGGEPGVLVFAERTQQHSPPPDGVGPHLREPDRLTVQVRGEHRGGCGAGNGLEPVSRKNAVHARLYWSARPPMSAAVPSCSGEQ